ncbi:hypothetical protein [Methylovirgula sp. 4M-Z18]|uniref:hypothetical protein n=1 Tax=Methylovirgula sp. 4M-Z18 TaxID=2293567 RepID=UPI001314AFA7|nr:hypothetical protein [Methylovirgula sp. 4M-Z18]
MGASFGLPAVMARSVSYEAIHLHEGYLRTDGNVITTTNIVIFVVAAIYRV